MAERTEMKKYIIISGFNIHDNNRGTGALGYGAISFLKEKGYLKEGQELLNICYVNRFWKYKNHTEIIRIQNTTIQRAIIYVSPIERFFFEKFGFSFPWTTFSKKINQVALVANINGGDGFSDIYGTKTFINRLSDTKIALKYRIPYIFLPQTLGPFNKYRNYKLAEKILRGANEIFIRDDKFIKDLDKMGLKYFMAKDLSVYMKPEPWNIRIKPNSIGLNISGLAYDNKFYGLANQFDNYPELIRKIIKCFQDNGKNIYLIPHSYNYKKPEVNNDDLVACRTVYNSLPDKQNITIVDKDMTPPQVKYVISQMSFFIGTRMHANFAAIYTNVPLFGLAYSYKFNGAFEAHNIFNRTVLINNIKNDEIDDIVNKIISVYFSEIK